MKSIAKTIENLFFPTNMAIAGAFILIIYFHDSPYLFNNIVTVTSAFFAYYMLRKLTARKIKSETKKFSTAASISLLLFIVLSIFHPVTKEVIEGALAVAIANFFTHLMRDKLMLSSHMMMCITVLTVLIWVNNIFAFGALLLPLIAWGRLKLKRHSYRQIFLGALAGVAIPVMVIAAF